MLSYDAWERGQSCVYCTLFSERLRSLWTKVQQTGNRLNWKYWSHVGTAKFLQMCNFSEASLPSTYNHLLARLYEALLASLQYRSGTEPNTVLIRKGIVLRNVGIWPTHPLPGRNPSWMDEVCAWHSAEKQWGSTEVVISWLIMSEAVTLEATVHCHFWG